MPTFPYAQPIGALGTMIDQLRKRFPEKIDSGVLKKLGIAPNNESYIINTLKFLGIIDREGSRTEDAHNLFVKGEDEFHEGLAEVIQSAYKPLFDLHDESAWTLEKSKLVNFIRTEDKSTDLVGGRQADTFVRLAEIAGKRQGLSTNSDSVAPKKEAAKRTAAKPKADKSKADRTEKPTGVGKVFKGGGSNGGDVSLAVRIEVNLPAVADQAVYDAIFKSIRSNLIDRD